jgi:shikimate kinase
VEVEPRQIRNIALIGFMGSGKSSVGRAVAEALFFSFVDTDQLIEERAGKPISEIFNTDGEATFRSQEKLVVEELARLEKAVISTGGGVPADPQNLSSLKTHALVVCLWATPEAIWERVRNQTHRPLLQTGNPLETIRELLAKRAESYKQADILINTAFRSVREVSLQVVNQYRMASKPHDRARH